MGVTLMSLGRNLGMSVNCRLVMLSTAVDDFLEV